MSDQHTMFPNFEDEREREWKDMPEFIQDDLTPFQQVIVSFKNKEDRDAFAKMIDQKLTYKTQSVWYPKVEIDRLMDKRYVDIESIPKRFIRAWIVGSKPIPDQFEEWWEELKVMHPDYEFVTLRDWSMLEVSPDIQEILGLVNSYAGVSDIVRILALYQIGGIYVDTDVMPIKSFDPLLEDGRPFLAHRSSKSFESAIMGSPKGHPAFKDLIDALPEWFGEHLENAASVQTGPGFVSSVLFGRSDILHLPIKTFYPYNGFMAPTRGEKKVIFKDKSNFPEEMIAAHFSNHSWGGNPNK